MYYGGIPKSYFQCDDKRWTLGEVINDEMPYRWWSLGEVFWNEYKRKQGYVIGLTVW